MEKSATSAGKKDPKELQNALAAVRNAVTTSEQQSATQLERLLLMRRRRYCQFITEYLAVLDKMRGLAAVITQAHERHHDKYVFNFRLFLNQQKQHAHANLDGMLLREALNSCRQLLAPLSIAKWHANEH